MNYSAKGKVRSGDKRGRILGFPTANINLHKNIPDGVYISDVILKSKKYKAATFVGAAETFGKKDKKIESYILDFDKDIYGEWMTVKFYKKIRGNKKFKNERELIEQIKKDIKIVENF